MMDGSPQNKGRLERQISIFIEQTTYQEKISHSLTEAVVFERTSLHCRWIDVCNEQYDGK